MTAALIPLAALALGLGWVAVARRATAHARRLIDQQIRPPRYRFTGVDPRAQRVAAEQRFERERQRLETFARHLQLSDRAPSRVLSVAGGRGPR